MGRRRRRQAYRPVRRRIPKVFNCPRCGAPTLMVTIPKEKGEARVTCGTCDLVWTTEKKSYEEKVDVYCRFVDGFLEGE